MLRIRQGVALGRLAKEHVTEGAVTGCNREQSNHNAESHDAPPPCGGQDTTVPVGIIPSEATTYCCRESTFGAP